MNHILKLAVCLLAFPLAAAAQEPNTITTVVGGGPNNVPAVEAHVVVPTSVVVDPSGNMFIVSTNGGRVFKVDPSGLLTVFAGSGGSFGSNYLQGPAVDAGLYLPVDAALDSAGNLFIAQRGYGGIARVDAASGTISWLHGGSWTAVAFDGAGNLYQAEGDMATRIYRRTPGSDGLVNGSAGEIETLIAGNGSTTYNGDNIPATTAGFAARDIAFDAAGNLFVADYNGRIRRIDAVTNIITTVVLASATGIEFDSNGNLYMAEHARVRRVAAGSDGLITGETDEVVTTIAGNGLQYYTGDNVPALAAGLSPCRLAFDAAGNLLVADLSNHRIRLINLQTTIITTVAGTGSQLGMVYGMGGPATNAMIGNGGGAGDVPIAFDSTGNMFVGSAGDRFIFRVDGATGIISTIAGSTYSGFSGDGGPATDARISSAVTGMVVSGAGDLYFADYWNHRIRRIDAAGIITTVAGNGVAGPPTEGQPAVGTSLDYPGHLLLDPEGNLFFSEPGGHRVWRIGTGADGVISGAADELITSVAGNGIGAFNGDWGPAANASLRYPRGLAFDAAGNLLIADSANRRVRRILAGSDALVTGTADEIITTVAGTGDWVFSGDGGPALGATFRDPTGLAFDSAGNLYVSDISNDRIRRITPGLDGLVTGAEGEIITTFVGSGIRGFGGDGGPATSARIFFPNHLAVRNGALYFGDAGNVRVRRVQLNAPPTANAGVDQTVECTGAAGASVLLDASASNDPDGDEIGYEWKDAEGVVVGSSVQVTLTVALGTHTYTLTVDDGMGHSATDTVTIVVRDSTAPVLTLSTTTLTAVLTTATTTSMAIDLNGVATATDVCDPNPVITHNAPALFPIGNTPVTFTATDSCGNSVQAQLTVQVAYTFSGFLAPIRTDGSSVFKAGRVVPIKFQLVAADGSFIINATPALAVFKVTDAVLGSVEIESPGASNPDAVFRFDPTTNQYILNLSTVGYSEGTYLLRVSLNDQAVYEVLVSIRV